MDVIFFVYLLTFSNGKIYVGMSRTDKKGRTDNRYRQHAFAARKGSPNPVYRAWRKHGPPEQVILSSHATREECALAEIDAIQAHDSMNLDRGYNLQPGGQGMHAPPGSAVYELMRAKVWNNPAVRKKLSEALKGRPLSEATRAAHKEWRGTPEAKAAIAAAARRPDVRAKASTRMAERLSNGYREYLSEVQTGVPKIVSPEGKARGAAARKAWAATPEGQTATRRGCAAMRANPENERKRREGHAAYLRSDTNKALCQANGARSAKPVQDTTSGLRYDSVRAASRALGVSGPTVHYWIKKGRFQYA